MSRARDLANLGDEAGSGIQVTDVNDLTVSASNVNSTVNQITDSSTDLNIDSNTLVVDKSANRVGIGTDPSSILHVDEGSGTSGFLFDSGLRRLKIVGSNSGSGYVSLEATDQDGSNASSRHLILEPNGGNVGIGTNSPDANIEVTRSTAGIAQYITNSSSSQAYTAYGNSDNPAWSQDFNTAGGLLVGIDLDETGVVYQGGNYDLRFGTNATERMRINSVGKITTTSANAGTAFEIENTNGSTNYGLFIKGGTSSSNAHYALGINNSANSAIFRVMGNGNVGIGTTSPDRRLHINASTYPTGSSVIDVQKSGTSANATNNYYMIFRSSTTADGYIFNNGSGDLAIISASDERLKENIRDADYGLNELMKLRPVTFDWKKSDNKNCKGFIAQEVQTVLPNSVNEFPDSEDNLLGLCTAEFIPLLAKAVQELSAKVEALENATH